MAIKKIKKVWNIVTTVLVCIVLVLAIALVGVRLFGVKVYTVLSGSMEPHFMTGSVIYVVDVEPEDLKERDVITYRLSGTTLATHRIIEVQGSGADLQFRTKGDNNDAEDANPVKADQVVGKAVFSIPLLGYLITNIQQPPGTYYAVVAGAALLLLMILPELLFDNKKEEKTNNENIVKEGKNNEENN